MKRVRASRNNRSALLLIVLLCSLCMAQTIQGAPVKEVKVGIPFPLTGNLAAIGKTCKSGVEMAIEELNAAGGIKSLGGAKIVPIWSDTRGMPDVAVSEAERLITTQGVCAILGVFQSAAGYPLSEVCERYEVPFIPLCVTVTKLTQRGFKYVFRPAGNDDIKARAMIDFLADMVQRNPQVPVKTISICYENTDWGRSVSGSQRKYALQKGFQLKLMESYPAGIADVHPIVQKIKAVNSDVLIVDAYISDSILLVKALSELGVEPKVKLSGGGGMVEPDFVKAVGDLAGDWIVLSFWNADIARAVPWIGEINKRYKERYGTDMSENSAIGYSIVWVLADALERAASTDPKAIRTALTETQIDSGPALVLPQDRIEFDETGQNPFAGAVILQYKGKEARVVWPDKYAPGGIKVVWPNPKWGK